MSRRGSQGCRLGAGGGGRWAGVGVALALLLPGCVGGVEGPGFWEVSPEGLDGRGETEKKPPKGSGHDSDDHHDESWDDSDDQHDTSGDDHDAPSEPVVIGQEVAVAVHLHGSEEATLDIEALLDHGQRLFSAVWTDQEGGGRPLTKGTGAPLSDPGAPLVFPRNFNRLSAPDANSCAGCHNQPFGIPGGGGDIVANVFVMAQRFDFLTLDLLDEVPTRGAMAEDGAMNTVQSVGNSRATLGMFGAGYIEMLARQMTADLQALRDGLAPGGAVLLVSKGVFFGLLSRDAAGAWETDAVEGLPAPSLATTGPGDPPSLLLRPYHQAGAVVSLRQFTNNAFNHHHGIQSAERFGAGMDPDGDGFTDELTVGDVTAASIYQATLPVPGRVIPDHPEIEAAIWTGEQAFEAIGCGGCHVSKLPLNDEGWVYSEPSPYNPPGNLRPGEGPTVSVDLGAKELPGPRLDKDDGVVWVPAYTDLKLHDICAGPGDPNVETLNMHAQPGTAAFFAGNRYFLTRKLWGVANEPPYFHHGQYTTLRQAILAHAGEAAGVMERWDGLSTYEQDAVVEFLKSLQILPPGTKDRVVNERFKKKSWPPKG